MKIYYFLKDFFTSKNVFFVDEQFTFNNAINDIESEHLIAIDTGICLEKYLLSKTKFDSNLNWEKNLYF